MKNTTPQNAQQNGSQDELDYEVAIHIKGVKDVKDLEYQCTVRSLAPPKELVRRTLRRIDLRILPLLIIVYALALLDRSNLGVARVAGMEDDLKLGTGERFSAASAIYFVPYIILELPSNLALRRLGARPWLAFITVAWGAVQVSEAFVKTWWQLVICRFLLGAGEAGFFPAIAYIITTWYTRYEVQTRLAIFYLVALFIGGFGSILAYGMSFLEGQLGWNGWQWIFAIEGAVTMLAGVVVYFKVIDFPDRNDFLTEEETNLVLRRIEDDRGDSVPDLQTSKKVREHLSDWKIWTFGLMFMTQTVPSYFVGFFLTIIIEAKMWHGKYSLLMSAPPHGFALVFALTVAWLSDKTHLRAPFLAGQTCMTMVGLLLTAFHPRWQFQYAGTFLITGGSASCIPGILAYAANNVTSQSKRAVSSAVIIAFGGVGGIIATTVFRQKDYPKYLPGVWVTFTCQILNLALLAWTSMHFRHQNEQSRKGNIGPIGGRPGFYYTL